MMRVVGDGASPQRLPWLEAPGVCSPLIMVVLEDVNKFDITVKPKISWSTWFIKRKRQSMSFIHFTYKDRTYDRKKLSEL